MQNTSWQWLMQYDSMYKLSRETSLESTAVHNWQQIRIKMLLTNADKHDILVKLSKITCKELIWKAEK